MPRRLRTQLALVLAVAMAPAGLLAVLQALAAADELIEQRHAAFGSEMRATALKQRDALQQVRNEVAVAADAAETDFLATGDCTASLTRLTGERYIIRAVLLDRQGRTVCGTPGWAPEPDPPGWETFLASPEATFAVAAERGETGTWPVVVLHPTVFMRPEAFAVAAVVDLAHLRLLALTEGEIPSYGVIDSTGDLVAGAVEGDRDWLPAEPGAILGSVERTATGPSRRGVERVYISQPLIEDQLWAIASVPETTLPEVVLGRGGLTVLAPILLWLIAIAVAYVSIDKLVTRHIAYLVRATSRIGRGDLETEVPPLEHAPAEIRALGDSIRDMARNLRERQAEMRELIEHQKSLILEIHHRVKNNLQMVTSLINIQLRRAGTEDERRSLRFLEDRVQSLAIIHHHLYGTEAADRITLGDLVRDICERLRMSMTPVAASVSFDYELDEMVVDSRIATPVALFLTEAVSNVFKHAVPQTGRHQIGVALRTDGERFALEIRNDMTHAARPKPERRDPQGLGMRLLRSFAAQLGGSFESIVDDRSFRLVLTAPIAARAWEGGAPAFSHGMAR